VLSEENLELQKPLKYAAFACEKTQGTLIRIVIGAVYITRDVENVFNWIRAIRDIIKYNNDLYGKLSFCRNPIEIKNISRYWILS